MQHNLIPSASAQQTIQRIQEGLRSSETASIAQVIELIRTVTSQSDSISIEALSEVIGRDLTIMFKLIRLANTLAFNPEGIPVTTISQAIQAVGFDRICNLAVSLLLLEDAEGRHCSAESREAAAMALVSGLFAQTVARHRGHADPEQAFVCSSLRNYGQLLLTTFLPEDYRQAIALTETSSKAQAFRTVFGLTPDELGQRILAEALLPEDILDGLKAVSSAVLASRFLTPKDQMRLMAEFGSALCELMSDSRLSKDDLELAFAELTRRYAWIVPADPKELMELIREVDQKLAAFGTSYGVKVFSSPFMRRLHQLATPVRRLVPESRSPELPVSRPSVIDPSIREIFLRGMAELTEFFGRQPLNTDRIWSIAAVTIRAGLNLRECWVFLQEGRDSNLRVCLGDGPHFEALREQCLRPTGHKTVFDLCRDRGEAVLIQNPQDPKIALFLPDWFKAVVQRHSFLLLPVRDSEGTFAIVYGSCGSSDLMDRLSQVKQELRLFCQHLGLIRRLRGS